MNFEFCAIDVIAAGSTPGGWLVSLVLVAVLLLIFVVVFEADSRFGIFNKRARNALIRIRIYAPWIYFLIHWIAKTTGFVLKIIFHIYVVFLELVASQLEGIRHHDFPLDGRAVENDALPEEANVQSKDIAELARMASDSWGEMRFTLDSRIAKYTQWHNTNPDTFKWVLGPDGQRLGYTCILPLSEDAYSRFRRGTLSQFSFEPDDFSSSMSSEYLVIQGVAVPPTNRARLTRKQRSSILPSKIIGTLYGHLACLSFEGPLPRVLADVCDEWGEKHVTRSGFAKVQDNEIDRTAIWELDASRETSNGPQSLNARAKQTLAKFRKYRDESLLELANSSNR